jgi:two-component system sensor histidine kinase UhpB
MPADIEPVSILIVEDNPGELFLLEEKLRGIDVPIAEINHAVTLAAAIHVLSIRPVELVFLDISLPDSFGLDSFSNLQGLTQRAAVILVTGLDDHNLALQTLGMGAQDYLVKGDFDERSLSRAVRHSLGRMRYLKQLRESEQRYRGLFQNNPIPMWVFDIDNCHVLETNEAAVKRYGYSREEFLGLTLADIYLDLNRNELQREAAAAARKRDGIKKGIHATMKKNGEVIFADIAWHWISYKGRPAILELANDVTERVQLERALNEQQMTRQRQITEAVIVAQEKERTEIGKELHDNVNQILGASNLYINTAMTDEDMRQELLGRSTELVSKAINEIRKISKSLITPGLREIGLIESIEDIIEDIRVAKDAPAIDLDLQNISEEQIEDRRKLTLFRIVQEQLNNVVKHARATRVLIRLSLEGHYIVLTVADNGVGFDAGHHRRGVGITNIISRAELFSGKVEIASAPGEGCVLTVSLPG